MMHPLVIRAALTIGIAAALVIAGAVAYQYIYDRGHQAGAAEVKAQWATEQARLLAEHAHAMKRQWAAAQKAQTKADRARNSIEQANREAQQADEQIRRATNENPDFFNGKRPADVQRLREQQLQRIDAAAQGLTHPMSE